MRKLTFLLTSIICISLCFKTAQAIPKIDAGGSAKEITTSISNFFQNAKKKIESSTAFQRAMKLGKGAIETAKQLDEIRKDAEEQIAAFEEDPLSAGLNLAQEGLDKASGEKNGGEANWADKISNKMNDAQKLLDVEAQKKKLEEEINKAVDGQKATLEGKIKTLEENNKNLQAEIEKDPSKKEEYEKQIANNNLKIKGYQTALSAADGGISSEKLQELTDLNSTLSSLQASAEQYAQEQKEKVLSAINEKLKSMTTEDDLKATTKNNFLAAGEPENSGNIFGKKTYRKQQAGNDAITTSATAAKIKKELPEMVNYTEKVVTRTKTADGTISSNTTDTQVTVEQVKALAKFIELTIYDLKLKTSSSIASYQEVSSTPDSNITTFSLDKYICTSDNKGEGSE